MAAEPVPFPESNLNFTAPSSMPDCLELPVHRANDGRLISRWRFTEPEIEEIRRTGCVWLHVYADRHPPVCLDSASPFVQDKEP